MNAPGLCCALPAWRPFARTLALLGVVLACTVQAAPGADAAWSQLTAAQRAALAPLQAQWAGIDPDRREMWLEVAQRFPAMPAEERARMQARMTEWSRLSPAERGQVRLQFQEAQRWTPQERQARWEAYQSLHPQARHVLAHRWKLEAAAQATAPDQPRAAGALGLAPPQAATSTSVRAPAGATTQPISRAGSGTPPLAARPAEVGNLVDPNTLLPRRRPSAAETGAAPAPARRPE